MLCDGRLVLLTETRCFGVVSYGSVLTGRRSVKVGTTEAARPLWIVAVRPIHVLAGIVLLAGFLRLWRLDQAGFGNLYYAATVRSMLTSPSNFLFGSFDPAGFVTVDKPPVGFWVQAAFAAVLGFSGLALQLPQALAGIAAVPVVYGLVARTFGAGAGLVAAFALAITPVSVAVDRNNTIDAQLSLVLLAATYTLLRATERGDARWLLASAALVGLGFNVKMAQAYLPVPAFALTYLLAARTSVVRRIAHLAAFMLVTLAVSLAWIAVVDLTPSGQRPFVGSSTNDSALQLATGHNGAARLGQLTFGIVRPGPLPPSGLPQGPPPQGPPPQGPPPPPGQPGAPQVGPPPVRQQPPAPGPGPQGEVGENGPLRLFNQQLAGQVSWSLPLALIGAVITWVREGRRWPITPRQRDVLLWTAWLIPTAVFLSFGGIIHRYYLVMLAPPAAALTGIALSRIAGMGRASRAATGLVAIAATAAVTLNAVAAAPAVWPALLSLIVASSAIGAIGLIVWLRWADAGRALSLSCALLALPPLLWATTPLDGGASGLPYASPELLRGGAAPGRPVGPAPQGVAAQPAPNIPGAESALVGYLLSQRIGERFIAATGTAGTAAPIIVATGLPVMAIGGFSGSDPIVDGTAFARRVGEGQVRFVIADDRLRPDVRDVVMSRCAVVPEQLRRGRAPGQPGPDRPGPGQPGQLFDCSPLRGVRW